MAKKTPKSAPKSDSRPDEARELELFMVQNTITGQYYETGRARAPSVSSQQPQGLTVKSITLHGNYVWVDFEVNAKRRKEIDTGGFGIYYGDRVTFTTSSAELHYRVPIDVPEPEVVDEENPGLVIREGARIEVGPVIEKGTPLPEAMFENADDLNAEPLRHPSKR